MYRAASSPWKHIRPHKPQALDLEAVSSCKQDFNEQCYQYSGSSSNPLASRQRSGRETHGDHAVWLYCQTQCTISYSRIDFNRSAERRPAGGQSTHVPDSSRPIWKTMKARAIQYHELRRDGGNHTRYSRTLVLLLASL